MKLEELAAREAIRELVACYAQLADRGRSAELADLFTEDGTLQIDDRSPLRGRTAIRDFLAGVATDRRGTSSGAALIRHHTSNLRITLDGTGTASGSCYFLVVTDRGLDHWGRYRDTYVGPGGDWRFRTRHVRVEGVAPGSWAAERRARSSSG